MNGTQTNQTLFDALRKSADPSVSDVIEKLIREGEDRSLCRVNVLKIAGDTGLDEEKTISGFLHAARLGLFELNWNVLCPGCGGVLDATRRSNRCARTATIARFAPAAMSPRSTRWSR